MPCETQRTITNLFTPQKAPPAQKATDLSAPGAQLRWQSAVAAAVDSLKNEIKLGKMPFRIANFNPYATKASK